MVQCGHVPVYCGSNSIPKAFDADNNKNGEFNWNGAFWLCNLVSNIIYPRYSAMIGSLREAQAELEDFFASKVYPSSIHLSRYSL